MAEPELLSEIRAQLDQVPWIHTLRSPATDEQLQRLPPGLRSLYEVTDGIDIHHTKYFGEIVGTALGKR